MNRNSVTNVSVEAGGTQVVIHEVTADIAAQVQADRDAAGATRASLRRAG